MRRVIVRGLNAGLSIAAAQKAAEQAEAAALTAAADAAAGVAAATFADRQAAEAAAALARDISEIEVPDDVITAVASDTTSDFYAVQAAAIGVRVVAPGARRVGGAGDSITVGSGATSARLNYINQSAVIAGTARAFVKTNGGAAGERSDQVLARVPAILATGLDHLHIQVGTNDGSQLVPLATFQANVADIVELAKIAGVSLSIGLVPPRGSGAAAEIHALIRAYNFWLRLWAPSRGVVVADTFTPLVDPTTGYLSAAADSGDGVHPSNAGHLAMARAVAPAIIDRHLTAPFPVTSIDPAGLIANPLMTSTAGWSARNTPASGARSIAVETPEPGDVVDAGNWLTIRLDNTAGGGDATAAYGVPLTAGFAAGDVIGLWFKTASGLASGKVAVSNNDVVFVNAIDYAGTGIEAPGPILITFTVPASPGTLRVVVSVTAPAAADRSVSVGQLNAFNLTQMGLANAYA